LKHVMLQNYMVPLKGVTSARLVVAFSCPQMTYSMKQFIKECINKSFYPTIFYSISSLARHIHGFYHLFFTEKQ
jgi:hypothetical protein